jgi:hypothetical protein
MGPPGYATTMTNAHVDYLTHHGLLLAVPAFLPAIVVVAVILYVALRDRRSGGKQPDAGQGSDAAEEKRD